MADHPAGLRRLAEKVRALASRVETAGLPLDGSWPSERATSMVNAGQILLWAVIAAVVLPDSGHFTYDQAYYYDGAFRVAEHLRPAPYGAFISGVFPEIFNPGGAICDLYAVPFLFFKDPRWGIGWCIVLSAVGLWAMDRALKRFGAAAVFRIAAVTLLTWSTWHARWTNTLWNANLFYFVTPVLLYCASRLVSEHKPELWSAAGLGVLSAVAAQIHLGGLMLPLVVLAVVVVHRPGALTAQRALVFAAALVAAYLPYLFAEASVDWANLKAFHRPPPSSEGFNVEAAQRSLMASAIYPSHAEFPPYLMRAFEGGWVRFVIAASMVGSGALALVGLATRFPLKLAPVLTHLGVPFYFSAIHRPYYDHYVGALVPFGVFLASAGAAWLLSHRGALRTLGVGYLAAFAVVGAVLPFSSTFQIREGDPWNGYTVKVMLARAQAELASGQPVRSGPRDELGYSRALLARHMLGKELTFLVAGRLCTVDLILTGLEPPLEQRHPGKVFIQLASNSVFVCD